MRMATSVLLTWIESSSRLSFSSTMRIIIPIVNIRHQGKPADRWSFSFSELIAAFLDAFPVAVEPEEACFLLALGAARCRFLLADALSGRWFFSFNLFFSQELQTRRSLYLAFGHISPLRWLHPVCPVQRQWVHSVEPHQMHFVRRGPGFFALVVTSL